MNGDLLGRWPVERANAWYATQPWLVGFNYVPSTACNDIEFWQAETFDPETIDRELGWAQETGFNTCRVFVNVVVYEADRDGLLARFDRFLDTAASHSISVMPVLFDDCGFSPDGVDPHPGVQAEPTPGVHNSCWLPSPGPAALRDRTRWGALEAYVKGMVGCYGRDGRVVIWDLFNEPGNAGLPDESLALVEAAFNWARDAGPDQPLTVGTPGLSSDSREIDKLRLAHSDVHSFHCYSPRQALADAIARYKRLGRPVVCTEWMARTLGSDWQRDLPLFVAEGVGCYSWGLVNGRTQTHYPWGSEPGAPEPSVWFHDLFYADGTPYDENEIEVIRTLTQVPGIVADPPNC